jgi:hypothetical protein
MREWNMIKRFALIGTLTLVFAAVALPGYAQTHVSIGIGATFDPPVAVVQAAPYPGYVWRPAPYVVHRRAYVAPLVVAAPYYSPYYAPYYSPYYAPYYSPYYAPYYSPYYAPRGLSLGFGFNVGHGHGFNVGHGHGFNVGHGHYNGHGGHHGRH